MFDIEYALIGWTRDELGVPCAATPPKDRPARFVTVERTGGASSLGVDRPVVAFQCWAPKNEGAAALAGALRRALVERATAVPEICRASVDGCYRFPDPDSRMARYQVVASFVTRL